VILLTGPSGSGKTTTAYACLREIQRVWGESRSVMTLEDPIEVAVTGITQSQVRTQVGFDLASGLKSLMRQDPDVILVGEIRDPATAEVVFQAALTGHLVLTTFHAGSAIEAITRLLDLQIEPYLLRSTLRSVICQRLVRRIQTDRANQADQAGQLQWQASVDRGDTTKDQKTGPQIVPGEILKTSPDSSDKLSGLNDHQAVPRDVATEEFRSNAGPGYNGRIVLAELLNPDVPEIAKAILQRADSRQLTTVAKSSGYRTLFDSGADAVRAGLTTEDEVFRVLGRPR
jgi:type II secretory ATPase GspE/PulE/Tfp pilus assembly ATPase PilB-like protein